MRFMFRSKGLATSPLSTSHESPQEEAEVEFQKGVVIKKKKGDTVQVQRAYMYVVNNF